MGGRPCDISPENRSARCVRLYPQIVARLGIFYFSGLECRNVMRHVAGMFIRHIARNATMAQAMRARTVRNGVTCRGHPLWSVVEDTKMHDLYPTYRGNEARLMRALPRRTYVAIKARARALGLAETHRVWTSTEVSVLRSLYPKPLSRSDLLRSLPGRTWGAVNSKAHRLRLKRSTALKILGRPVLDAIRERTRLIGWSLVDLDRLARTRSYFRKGYQLDLNEEHGALLKAIRFIGGRVEVSWK